MRMWMYVQKCNYSPSGWCGVSLDKLLGGVIGTMLSDLKRSWGFQNGIYIYEHLTQDQKKYYKYTHHITPKRNNES